MSMTVMDDVTKWQPSVLRLLPFSRNNAGIPSPSSLVTQSANQQASYNRGPLGDRKFPSLTTTTREGSREKPRSKSAAVVEDGKRYSQSQQQHRLLRATSERLSRPQRRLMGRRSYIERAQSEYNTKASRKLTQEVVTFAIKDINEQILDRTLPSPDLFGGVNPAANHHDNDNNFNHNNAAATTKVRPLLKPVLQTNEGRWPRINPRFWRSSTISPGEKELQRHKLAAFDVQLSGPKRSKLVKLNVKDLPRSQTPIGENDPDKLNMKQVIAFLQSSGEVSGVTRRDIDENLHRKQRVKSSSSNTTRNFTSEQEPKAGSGPNGNHSTVLLIAAKSRRKGDQNNFPEVVRESVKSDTFLTQGDEHMERTNENKDDDASGNISKNNSNDKNNDNNNNINNNDQVTLYPEIGPETSNPHKSSHYDDGMLSNSNPDTDTGRHRLGVSADSSPHHRTQSKTLQFGREDTDFRIPARIRQIRDGTVDNRPFRLHRFLTLVNPNNPEDKNNNPVFKRETGHYDNNDDKNNTNYSKYIAQSSTPSLPSKSSSRSSSKLSKSRSENREKSVTPGVGGENYGHGFTDAQGYFLRTTTGPGEEEDRIHHQYRKQRHQDGRRKSKSSQSFTTKDTEVNDYAATNGRIICLPTAAQDADSDDDFISLPTMPSKATRKNLTLSANGRAILAKHFPQVSNFHKSNMRPQSEKILLKRRMDISNGRNRPSSVKDSDLVEWGGMENPGKIFLSDRTDSSSKRMTSSPQTSLPPANAIVSNRKLTDGEIDDKNEHYENENAMINNSCNNKLERPVTPCDKTMDSTSSESKNKSKSKHKDEPSSFACENQVDLDPEIVSGLHLQQAPVVGVVPENKNSPSSKVSISLTNGATSTSRSSIKPEVGVSPSSPEPVRLTLRKERNLTRVSTYMVDMNSMKSTGNGNGYHYSGKAGPAAGIENSGVNGHVT